MNETDVEALRFPVGKFTRPDTITPQQITEWIREIEALPGQIRQAVAGLSHEQLSLHYRPGGWTIRQVVHHVADSHMNSFMRFKLTLTEDKPTIKPYLQEKWSELPDGNEADVNLSIQLLESLHARWAVLLKKMTPEQFKLTYIHPERSAVQTLEGNLALYAWHGRHHLAHIKQALELKY